MGFLRKHWGIFVVILLSIPSALPFFSLGFFPMHDDTQVARVFEMSKALSDGMLPVRWVQDLGYGFGYSIFNFYSVLPYYLGGILTNFGIDVLVSTKIIFVLALILSGVSMFVLVKEFFGKTPALVSSIVYLYFPYHAVDTYVRGDLAEIYAYALLPLVFLGLFKIHQGKKISRLYLILTSVSIAGVIISHNLSAFMLFIFIALFIVFSLSFMKERKRLILSYSFILIIAFLLSAFYSLPAVFEMKNTNILSQVGGGSHYADHFVCLSQLWDSPWGFGGSAPGCIDGMSFKLGKLNVLLIGVGFLLLTINFKKLKDKLLIVSFVFLSFALSVFMTLEYSRVLWGLPLMGFLQFPWRFLNFVGLFTAVIIGYLIWQSKKYVDNKVTLILASIIIILTLIYNTRLFAPKTIHDRNSSFYTNEVYLKWTVSRISDEYLPRNFTKPASPEDLRSSTFDIVGGSGNVSMIEKKTQVARAQIDLKTKGTVRANIAFFPAWTIRLDQEQTSYIARDDGMYINVPEGKHSIEARFAQTPIEKTSNILSVIGVLALLVVIIGKPDILYGKKTP